MKIWYHLIYIWIFAIIECLEDYSTKGERYFEEDIFEEDILKAYLSKIYSTKGEIISLP